MSVHLKKTVMTDAPGRYVIEHPDTPMSDEQRAWEMFAVHPLDLDRMGFKTRTEYFLAHLKAVQK